jgi:hypothetical protein
MASDLRSELLSLEKRFWDAMQRKDGDAAARMSGDACVIVGAQGVSAIDKSMMAKLTVEGDWSIESYEFDDESVQVQALGEDTALIAYKVTERLRVGGEPLTLEASDSSVWRRENGDWVCVLHTESPAGDPFGRDRK